MDLAFIGANIVTPSRVVKNGTLTTKKNRIYHVGPDDKSQPWCHLPGLPRSA